LSVVGGLRFLACTVLSVIGRKSRTTLGVLCALCG
jgi:hypothetical protein